MPTDHELKPSTGTWGAFKARIEALGVTDTDEMGYIDVSFDEPMRVDFEARGVCITSGVTSEDAVGTPRSEGLFRP